MTNRETLEEKISRWRHYLQRKQAITPVDVDELEDHLRSHIENLLGAGLDEDEAFLVAVKRLGSLDEISREFAVEYSERLWKQLVLSPEGDSASPADRRQALLAMAMALAAALAMKIPALFGLQFGEHSPAMPFYLRNLWLFVLPFMATFFGLKRRMWGTGWLWLSLPFVVSGLIVNLMPFGARSHTGMLTAIHLPIALWLWASYAYAGGRQPGHDQRMNYIRFSGEWFIYYTLIALGGGLLMALTQFLFEAVGLNAERALQEWILPCGATGAVIIAAWLVEQKQSVIENMAPVLTRLFSPLFAALLLVFVAAVVWTGNPINIQREVLIGFDLLLVLVLGLILYSISARDPQAPPGHFDALQLLLVVCALVVDGLALWAMAGRISEFGFSPNKLAALGLNLLLLTNLAWSAVLYARFLARRIPFIRLERWQTGYLPVFGLWAAVVAIFFPIIFSYR
ncbi:MAG: permease prefix domain 1-containing protein [Candidatus Saccharicenans sp.]|nr:permease prefix domain 1-containing protein [Candidatus Saccharicenans sp.]